MKGDAEKVVDIKSRIHAYEVPEELQDITKLPHEVYEDILDNTVKDDEVKNLFKRAVSLFFKKLGEIITAIFKTVLGVLTVRK